MNRRCLYLLLLAAQCSQAQQIDECEEEKDCSLKFGNDTLQCEVGHRLACRRLDLELHAAEKKSRDQQVYLSYVNIYDRLYKHTSWKSFMFEFRLPNADLGVQGDVQGVRADFYQHEALDNVWNSYINPVCRYFEFIDPIIPKAVVEREKLTISYNCIGIDIRPGLYGLRLQTIPGSLPLVYDISWAETEDSSDYFNYYFDGEVEGSVWSHQLIAVAQFKGHVNDVNTSLHVVFPRVGLDTEIIWYDVILLEESSPHAIKEQILLVEDDVTDIFFHDVQPGRYKVKVKAQGYSCEPDCPSLESSSFDVVASKSLPATSSSILMVVGLSLAAVLLATVACVVVKWCITSNMATSGSIPASRSPHSKAKVVVTVTSLADRHLEQQASNYFCRFLRDALGTTVCSEFPSMPRSSSDSGSLATPTGSETGDDVRVSVSTPTSDISDVKYPLVSSEILNIILAFSYSTGRHDDNALFSDTSVLDLNSRPAVKNVSELDSLLQQIVDKKGADRVLCVTFSQTQLQNRAPSGVSRATSRLGLNEDQNSLANFLSSDSSQLYLGVRHLLLPDERNKLYIQLGAAFNKTHADFLNSEHLLDNAVWTYNKASFYPGHREGDGRSVVTINSVSSESVTEF